ncbi:DNA repair protein complementing XP-C cells homolog [Agrilus planipennis]|uniref:DNA repair protein complementing XP-C cells homolog n=1 Tax=Agrilus planipennis TaxID=224129 RepID=A0A1W4X514_AGRPL|nr:DNA repair protein complementing XP-C cells homolog [Agrilus planipennis]
MRRTRRNNRLSLEDKCENSDDDDFKRSKIKKIKTIKKKRTKKLEADGSSSSESDLDNYLKTASEIDLNSSFFQNPMQPEQVPFETIEKDIFSDVKQLSDSSSENEVKCLEEEHGKEKLENKPVLVQSSNSKLNFQHLHDYTRKLEDAKKHIEKYILQQKNVENSKGTSQDKPNKDQDILSMLAQVEAQPSTSIANQSTFNYNLDLSDSEKEDWEEVIDENNDLKAIAKDIQITVSLPEHMRKKKGEDLQAAIKRRLNRIKKENQILIHKVHLLCWIAHGNYVNNILNDPNLLASALSLVPSEKCYPKGRADLKYLQQFTSWYSNTIKLTNKPESKYVQSLEILQEQITQKEAHNSKSFVYIFICILRALGLQCRLILSFRVAPLRPPSSELHSLSLKEPHKKNETVQKEKIKTEDAKQGNLPEKKNIRGNTTKKKGNLESSPSGSKDNTNITDLKKGSRKKQATSNNTGSQIKQTKKVIQEKKNTTDSNKPEVSSFSISEKIKLQKHQNQKAITNTKMNITKLKPTNQMKKNIEQPSSEESYSIPVKHSLRARSSSSNVITSLKNNNKSEIKIQKATNKQNLIEKKSKKPVLRSQQKNLSKTQEIVPQLDGANDGDSESNSDRKRKPNLSKLHQERKSSCSKNHPRRLRKTVSNYKESTSDSEDDFQPSPSQKLNKDAIKDTSPPKPKIESKDIKIKQNIIPEKHSKGGVKEDIIKLVKGVVKNQKMAEKAKLVKIKRSKSESDDSDYAPEANKRKFDSDEDFKIKSDMKVKKRVQWKNDRRVLSSDSDQEAIKQGNDVWAEVFLEAEEKWISVDVIKAEIHCVNALYSRASKPVSYIIAWNNDNTLKDVTSRYCQDWHTVIRKLRVNSDWWKQTLKPYIGKPTARDKEEDEELAQMQLEKPLPKTISEYKNHPLYALQRHLLKFEAIYPPDAVPLGYIRGEPVYSRYCVYTLHSREIWLKQAKVVKRGEKPYKIVKARPKYDKLSGKVITDLPLEIFGMWQVEDYDPPTAENGVVPRNAYGNVDLFKECMLPKGCVHLRLPGLNKIAYKLKIDCAEAVTGFDFHGGWSHPIIDGYVVCVEYEDILVAAWHMEQEEQERKEQEKIEKRIYGNWKKLIKGLLIRERLNAKYNFKGKPEQSAPSSNEKRKAKPLKMLSKKKRRTSSEHESQSD